MKTLMLIVDGMSDETIPGLHGRTPMQAAHKQHIDALASRAETGFIDTAYPGLPVESLACIMGLLGYDPRTYYPSGRASFEALGRGISLGPRDLALRCNIVHVTGEPLAIDDFSAGALSDEAAGEIVRAASAALPDPTWELYPGQSYRNILVVRDAPVTADDLALCEPYLHLNEPLTGIAPRARAPHAEPFVRALRDFQAASRKRIEPRLSGGMFWLWSPSTAPALPQFEQMHRGRSGGMVAALDFMKGLAGATGMRYKTSPRFTGYADTDYAGKAAATIRLLDARDFVVTHVNAADEAAHQRDFMQKRRVIESVDTRIVGPVYRHLQTRFPGAFAVVVCCDHKTRSTDGKHAGDPVPYLLYRDWMPTENPQPFGEHLQGATVPSSTFLQWLWRDAPA